MDREAVFDRLYKGLGAIWPRQSGNFSWLQALWDHHGDEFFYDFDWIDDGSTFNDWEVISFDYWEWASAKAGAEHLFPDLPILPDLFGPPGYERGDFYRGRGDFLAVEGLLESLFRFSGDDSLIPNDRAPYYVALLCGAIVYQHHQLVEDLYPLLSRIQLATDQRDEILQMLEMFLVPYMRSRIDTASATETRQLEHVLALHGVDRSHLSSISTAQDHAMRGALEAAHKSTHRAEASAERLAERYDDLLGKLAERTIVEEVRNIPDAQREELEQDLRKGLQITVSQYELLPKVSQQDLIFQYKVLRLAIAGQLGDDLLDMSLGLVACGKAIEVALSDLFRQMAQSCAKVPLDVRLEGSKQMLSDILVPDKLLKSRSRKRKHQNQVRKAVSNAKTLGRLIEVVHEMVSPTINDRVGMLELWVEDARWTKHHNFPALRSSGLSKKDVKSIQKCNREVRNGYAHTDVITTTEEYVSKWQGEGTKGGFETQMAVTLKIIIKLIEAAKNMGTANG